MAYPTDALLELVERRLAAEPAARLQEIAHGLGVDRHTIERALQTRQLTFGTLRRQAMHAAVERYRTGEPLLTRKELAARLKCSPRTLRRLMPARDSRGGAMTMVLPVALMPPAIRRFLRPSVRSCAGICAHCGIPFLSTH